MTSDSAPKSKKPRKYAPLIDGCINGVFVADAIALKSRSESTSRAHFNSNAYCRVRNRAKKVGMEVEDAAMIARRAHQVAG